MARRILAPLPALFISYYILDFAVKAHVPGVHGYGDLIAGVIAGFGFAIAYITLREETLRK